jgi:hypothetical protein
MNKIKEIVAKCIELLDSTVTVTFCPITAAAVDLERRESLLPDWKEELYPVLMSSLHELAHVWYSTPIPNENLTREERGAFEWIEDAFVDSQFCRTFPELRFDFLRKYLQWEEEYKNGGGLEPDSEFWFNLTFTAWDEGKWDGLATRSLGIELIEGLKKVIALAKSSSDLIPAVKKIVLEAKKNNIRSTSIGTIRLHKELMKCGKILKRYSFEE